MERRTQQKLLTVTDRFQISGRGLIVVPGVLLEKLPQPITVEVELVRPDGTKLRSEAKLQYEFSVPSPQEYSLRCIFGKLTKDDVPIGTEIWLIEDKTGRENNEY